jgi:hypothetical protein
VVKKKLDKKDLVLAPDEGAVVFKMMATGDMGLSAVLPVERSMNTAVLVNYMELVPRMFKNDAILKLLVEQQFQEQKLADFKTTNREGGQCCCR